jgi:hypothetical protein
MKKVFSFLFFGCLIFSCRRDKEIIPGTLPSYENNFGTSGTDVLGYSVVKNDGSLLAAGYTNGAGAGGYDGWLVNLSAKGEVIWQQTFGGSADDYFTSILKTSDNGFLLCGYSNSASAGMEDAWLIKLNEGGLVQWEKKYGGIATDLGINAVQLSDSSFIVCASTQSYGAGALDHWLLKLDATGNMISQKTFGDITVQGYSQIMQKPDGNFFISGRTDKNGNSDADVIEINSNLDSLREFIFGSADYEEVKNILALPDGNFVLAGHTAGFGHPEHDFYCVKFDASGTIVWEKTYGSLQHDGAESSMYSSDGELILCGRSDGNSGNSEDLSNLVLDGNGNELHQFYKGSTGVDAGQHIFQNGNYIYTVGKKANENGDVDGWVLVLPVSQY